MKINFIKLFFLVVITSAIISCGQYQSVLKSTDNDKKYEMAMKYYNQKDYYRALQLFDQLIPIYRGTSKAEIMAYSYAYCYFNQQQYILAAYQFSNFASTFPKSDKAEECVYMSAYCKYLDSPATSLDQTNTFEALQELQMFINLYPKSSRIEKCNELIDKLRYGLETKAFENAQLYYKIEDYIAAITSFKNLLQEYPDTKYAEEALFLIVKSNFKLASNSIEIKKQERFANTLEACNNFIKNFPLSIYFKECNNINRIALKEFNKYKTIN